MSKYHYFIYFFIVLFALSACHSLWTTQIQPTPQLEPVMKLPQTEIPIPVSDFTFIFPEKAKIKSPISPHKHITVNFSAREKSNVSVTDPKLMTEGKMLIDLKLIQKEDYAFPLPGAKIISPYAGRRRNHTGIDLKTHPKDTIVSAFDGIVRLAKPYFAYGNIVVVRHYNGLETLYSHNTKNLVKPGDKVKAGQPIAISGRTGRATTDHLHFEVRVNGQHINPNIIFNLEERKLKDDCLSFTQEGNKITVETIKVMPHQLAGDYNPYQKREEKELIKEERGSL
jgi:murein DD-endopeptidase MepM/ murein hydrolase activator NlpD